jgi:hypothetical protein
MPHHYFLTGKSPIEFLTQIPNFKSCTGQLNNQSVRESRDMRLNSESELNLIFQQYEMYCACFLLVMGQHELGYLNVPILSCEQGLNRLCA